VASTEAAAARLAIAMSLGRCVRELALAGIRADNPNASARDIETELAVRLYGSEVARRLFGPRPA
jgi:hypothetical protein